MVSQVIYFTVFMKSGDFLLKEKRVRVTVGFRDRVGGHLNLIALHFIWWKRTEL